LPFRIAHHERNDQIREHVAPHLKS
jgi:hypothetical protein